MTWEILIFFGGFKIVWRLSPFFGGGSFYFLEVLTTFSRFS